MIKSKVFLLFCLFCLGLSVSAAVSPKSGELTVKMIDGYLDRAVIHAKNMAKSLEGKNDLLPRSKDASGKLTTCKSPIWTSGFYPGELWYLYEYSKDNEILDLAENFSKRVEDQQFNKNSHDIGFVLNCSFGNGYRVTGNKKYVEVLENGAKSLSTRFNPKVGLIKSWATTPQRQYPVIIDNMMNLELLLWVSQQTKKNEFKLIALSHADKTMQNHFRPDNSCYHLVSYDTITAVPHLKQTVQGLNDSSAWARGQGWALYGYTMVYRFTKEKRYLEQAIKVAEYITHNPLMPADKIPLWDFNAAPDAYRDASAAAVMASALIELSGYVPEKRIAYLNYAKDQLLSLASDQYYAALNTNANYLMIHNVGHLPINKEVDAPLTYADYYFVEALLRYKKVISGK
jgi:unsaturated chondroitin disaccharide hydrolase